VRYAACRPAWNSALARRRPPAPPRLPGPPCLPPWL